MRPYELGDDVRRIDWNVTARTGEPHVRLHVAERAVETWLVLDTSASMTFGTADRRKWDVAEGVALAVGHVAARRGNRLAVSTFGDRPADDLAAAAGHARRPARSCSPLRRGAGPRAGRADLARRRRSAVSAGSPGGARSWSWSRTSAARATGAPQLLAPRGPPRRDRRRDPRPARAGARRHRRPLARRPRDGPAAPRRHAQPQAPRGASTSSPRPTATRSRASCARSAPATSCSRPQGDWLKPLVGFLKIERRRR